jgi:DNA-directed RNA polymerase beta' subunit
MLGMKLRINDEHPIDPVTGKERTGNIYTMALPIAVCGPLNADFDGDTMSMHLVPPEAAEDVYNKMSPRYVNVYKKTNETIYVPNHETLNGLAVASEVTGTPEELQDPKEYYTSYTELLKDVEIKKTLPIGKPIVFTVKVGSEDYQNKITTYGRLRLSKIIDADIDKIGIFDKPFERISAKSGGKLYQFLLGQPDGVEKIQALQKYALMVVTKAGVVTFDFKTLWADTDTKTYREICQIADSPDLSDKQKLLMMNEKYKVYMKEIENSYGEDLKNEMARANRVKLSSIVEMTAPSLIVSGVDEKPIINRHTLVSGLTNKDYIYHAVENRSLQSIKNAGTPSSGYVEMFTTTNYTKCWNVPYLNCLEVSGRISNFNI